VGVLIQAPACRRPLFLVTVPVTIAIPA